MDQAIGHECSPGWNEKMSPDWLLQFAAQGPLPIEVVPSIDVPVTVIRAAPVAVVSTAGRAPAGVPAVGVCPADGKDAALLWLQPPSANAPISAAAASPPAASAR